MTQQDFYSTALTSLRNQISSSNSTAGHRCGNFNPSEYAKYLVEDDVPKIDSAVKSYLSLVAARSVTVSNVDVMEVTTSSSNSCKKMGGKCMFFDHPNRASLVCARTLLVGVNSTILPDNETNNNPIANTMTTITSHEKDREGRKRLQYEVVRILWNGLVNSTVSTMKKELKPSKLLGRDALLIAYPYIKERFRRGIADVLTTDQERKEDGNPSLHPSTSKPIQTMPNNMLPPIPPPINVDLDQWEAYYTEFGNLLRQACCITKEDDAEDDSALLWSNDGGAQELRERRDRRMKRADDALVDDNRDIDSTEN